MGMFGNLRSMSGVYNPRAGSIAGFNPAQPSFIDKLGLAGDILTGNPVTKTRLDEDFAFNQAQYQAQHPAPMKLGAGDSYIDPMTGKVLFSAPASPPAIAQNVAALNAMTPGLGDTYARNYANNGGGQGPASISVNGQQMMRVPTAGAPPVPPPEAIARLKANPSEAHLFDETFGPGASARHLGTGGAAPATGPGGFPLYPAGH